MNPLQSLVACGTKLWLDSIDPDLVRENRAWGATGATSNPIIISDLIKTGRFDDHLKSFMQQGQNDHDVAWSLTDHLVKEAQQIFRPVYEETNGDDGYVSFELDPLLEDLELKMPVAERSRHYIELGKRWNQGHTNRMIKVPATPAGLGALEELSAAGITLNVTLIFSARQFVAAHDAVWRGAQRRPGGPQSLKSVYSIFVSRIDVYTQKLGLSDQAQGQVGIVNAKRIWQMNQKFWADKGLPRKQEIIFASTGTKLKTDDPTKYVAAFAGSDIETNPPATNEAVFKSGKTFTRQIDQMPPAEVLNEIEAKIDFAKLEDTLMMEGLQKFADPQKALLALIAAKRRELGEKK